MTTYYRPTLVALAIAGLALSACDTEPTINTPPTVSIDTSQLELSALTSRTFTPTLADADGDDIVLSLKQPSSWLHIHNNKVYASPANGDAGTHEVTFVANDGTDSVEYTATFTVTENNPLPPLADYRERHELRDEVFYFVMADRFLDGDSSNNLGDPNDPLAYGGFEKTKDGFYHGGDIPGLMQKLNYIEDLGATAIWLTPILKNKAVQGDSAGYHGYWTLDFTQIDPHLGSNEDLKAFIDAAHAKNIRVYFDIIVNHTADVIKYEECHNHDGSLLAGLTTCEYRSLAQKDADQGYTPFIPTGEENAKVPAWLNDLEYYNNQGESTWAGENSVYGDFVGLDDLDTLHPDVVAGFTDVFKDLVREFRPDGFRVDTVKHVNLEFWKEFTPAVLEYARAEDTDGTGEYGAGIEHFTMFGEVFSGDIAELAMYTNEGMIPSTLDFAFQGLTTDFIKDFAEEEGSLEGIMTLFERDDEYTNARYDSRDLLTFLGNHDKGRFAYFLQDVPDITASVAQAMTNNAHAFMYFTRGVPVVYYGAEQGFIGTGGDKAARQNMQPSLVSYYNNTDVLGTEKTSADFNFDTDHPFYLEWREYARLLREHPVLRHGIQVQRDAKTNQLFAFSRVDFTTGEEYLLVFSFRPSGTRSARIETDAAGFEGIYGYEGTISPNVDGEIIIQVPAQGFVILKATSELSDLVPAINSIDGPSNDENVAGNVRYEVEVNGAAEAIIAPFKVELLVSDDNGGNFTTVATDYTVPYNLFLRTHEFDDEAALVTKVRVTNLAGDSDESATTPVTVDNRPITAVIHYEGASANKNLALNSGSGTKQFSDSTSVSFDWTELSDVQLVFYTPPATVGGALQVDQPIWLSRQQIAEWAQTNQETGDLEANVYINNNGDVANASNDVGGSSTALAQPNLPNLGQLGVRGSLNSWNITNMTDNGNYHAVTIDLALGDIEFKVSDDSWTASKNFGGPITENGLTVSGTSGNLRKTTSLPGDHTFYFLAADLSGNGESDQYLVIIHKE